MFFFVRKTPFNLTMHDKNGTMKDKKVNISSLKYNFKNLRHSYVDGNRNNAAKLTWSNKSHTQNNKKNC